MNYWEVKMSKGKVFNAQEVQAIIAGNKTMFREVIKSKPLIKRGDDYLFDDNGKIVSQKDCCPYQVGQKIFVKESFNIFAGQVAFKQNLANAEKYIWKPAQHMKQEHSRLTLQIKEITVERLQDINEEDLPQGFKQIKDRNYFMYDTHIKRISCNCGNDNPTLLFSEIATTFLKESGYKFMCPQCKKTPNKTYITANGASCDWNDLIDPFWREKSKSTHKKPDEKFEANPWVWAIQFEVVKNANF